MTHTTATKRPARDRGHTQLDWLESWHTFSFGGYHDPAQHSFRTLRVINDDIVAPGRGFPEHPHRNMEILTYVISGQLSHRDSMGHTKTVGPGQVQYMSAGAGLTHSEFNASPTESVHLLQIWIAPHALGLRPTYAEWAGGQKGAEGLTLIASPTGASESLTVRQDVAFYVGRISAGETIEHATTADRGVWVQMIQGEMQVGGESLEAGDGLALEGIDSCEIAAKADAEFLLFDLA